MSGCAAANSLKVLQITLQPFCQGGESVQVMGEGVGDQTSQEALIFVLYRSIGKESGDAEFLPEYRKKVTSQVTDE